MSNELLIKSIKARQAMAAHAAKVESTVENVDSQADENTEEIKRLIKAINSDVVSNKVPSDLFVVNYKQILETLNYPTINKMANKLYIPSMPLFLSTRQALIEKDTQLQTNIDTNEQSTVSRLASLRTDLIQTISNDDTILANRITNEVNTLNQSIDTTNQNLATQVQTLSNAITNGDDAVTQALTTALEALDLELSTAIAIGDDAVTQALTAALGALESELRRLVYQGDYDVTRDLTASLESLDVALRDAIKTGDQALNQMHVLDMGNLARIVERDLAAARAEDLEANNLRFLGITAKATDSEKLDGIDSSSFLRSDQDDTTSGQLTLSKKDLVLTLGNLILSKGKVSLPNESGYWLETEDITTGSGKSGLYLNTADVNNIKLEVHHEGVMVSYFGLNSDIFSGTAEKAGLASRVDVKDSYNTDDYRDTALTDLQGAIFRNSILQVSVSKNKAKATNLHTESNLTLGSGENATIKYNDQSKSIDFIMK